jgi:hypothetical protein
MVESLSDFEVGHYVSKISTEIAEQPGLENYTFLTPGFDEWVQVVPKRAGSGACHDRLSGCVKLYLRSRVGLDSRLEIHHGKTAVQSTLWNPAKAGIVTARTIRRVIQAFPAKG